MAGVNIATAYVDIIPAIKGIRSETRKMMGEFDKAGKRSGGLFKNAFAGGIGGLVAVTAMKALSSVRSGIANTIQSFSDFEDATGAAEVVFGKSMKKIIQLSKTAHRTMGMTKAQVIDASNTFGVFGESAGLTGSKLADFSIDLTKLAGDLSSFKGGTVEEAITAIGAALRGESEPIRRYGVLLDDATVKQQALKMGLIKTTKEALTPQNRTLAVSRLLFEKTKLAQGDFARTFVSTQNTAKTFQASVTNAIASFGGVYAPLVSMAKRIGTDVFDFLGRKFESFRLKHDETFRKMRANLEIFLAGKIDNNIFQALDVDPNSINTDKIIRLRVTFNENVHKMKETLENLFKPTWESITKNFSKPIQPNISAGAFSNIKFPETSAFTPLQGLFKAIADNAPKIGQALGQVSDALVKAFVTVAPSVAKILPVIAEAFVKLVPALVPIIPVLANLTIKFLELITPILQNETLVKALAFAFVGFKIGKIVGLVGRFAGSLFNALGVVKNFVTAGGGLFARMRGIVEVVRLRFMYFGDGVRKVATVLRSGFGTVLKGVGVGFRIFGNVISKVATIFRVVLSTALKVVTTGLRALFTVMRANPIGAIITVIGLLIAGIVYLWNNCETFRNIIYSIWETLKGWAAWIGGVLIQAWNSISTAVSNATSTAWNTIKGWIGNITGFFSSLGSTLYNSGAAIINGLWDGMKSIWNKITSWVKDGLDYIRSFFPFSPAKRGPFSGKGWVYYSGKSIGEGLAQGIKDSTPATIRASESLMKTMRDVYDTQNNVRFGFYDTHDSNNSKHKSGGVVVNLNTKTTSTAEEIAREVTWNLAKL